MQMMHDYLECDVEPLSNQILAYDLDKGEYVSQGGIILMDDDGITRGIHPRWARVYKVGKNIDYLTPGECILVDHGRWTYGYNIKTEKGDFRINRIDPNGILLVADEKPKDWLVNTKDV